MSIQSLCRIGLLKRSILPAQVRQLYYVRPITHNVIRLRHLTFVRTYSDYPPYHRDLTPAEFDKVREQSYVVDVREPDELMEIAPVPGANNIPLGTLPDHIADIPQDKVIFYCRGGVRSLKAVGIAQSAGLIEPQHLEGGITAWVEYHQQKK